MGYEYVPSLRPPFTPSWPFPKTPISEFYSSSRPYICLKSQTSGKFAFQSLKKSRKVQFLCLEFGQISVRRASNSTKTQFFKMPSLAAVHSLSLYFWPLGPHTHTKMKCEAPTPAEGTCCIFENWLTSVLWAPNSNVFKVDFCNW